MTQDLYWLTLTALFTGLLWVPYILNRFVEQGIFTAIFGSSDRKPNAAWADRLMDAHRNAIENLVVFAPLVLIVTVAELNTELTAKIAMLYFVVRLLHAVTYTFAVPGARTVCFLIGFACQIIFAFTAIGYF